MTDEDRLSDVADVSKDYSTAERVLARLVLELRKRVNRLEVLREEDLELARERRGG